MNRRNIPVTEIFEQWLSNPGFVTECNAVEAENALSDILLQTRSHSGLTRAQVAQRMQTSAASVARLEGGDANPSLRTLHRYAEATGTRLRVSFEQSDKSGESMTYPITVTD